MKYEQNTAFLSICSPLKPDLTTRWATAALSLNQWPFRNYHQPESLMLEGLNQFAVRIATAVYPDSGKKHYLPTMIENFQTVPKEFPAQLVISGCCEMVHDTCRVMCNVTADDDDTIIATAVIMVSKVLFDISTATRENDNPDLPLWVMELNVDNHAITDPVSFCFNDTHPLFTEHFPGYAVAPGSMLVDIVLKRLMLFYPRMHSITLSRVKFVQAVLPDIPHCLYLRFSQRDFTASFFLCSRENSKRAAMGTLSFTPVEGE